MNQASEGMHLIGAKAVSAATVAQPTKHKARKAFDLWKDSRSPLPSRAREEVSLLQQGAVLVPACGYTAESVAPGHAPKQMFV